MKIAVVIPKYGLMGGAETFAYELTERLASRGDFHVHVFAHRWRKGNSCVRFHRVPILMFPRFLKQVSFAYFSNKMIRGQNYDLVHGHDRILQMDLLTMHGIPHRAWIKQVRQKPQGLFDRSLDWLEKKGLKGPNIPLVMPVSSLVKNELLKRYDIPQSKIRVIHPGVSTERFSSLRKEKHNHEIRERHGLSPDDIIVLFVGMNFEIKRLGLVMKSIAKLRERVPNFPQLKLMVVGKGDQRHYRRIAWDLGISEQVIFTGVVHDVEKYFLASDIFAMPSVFDTFGLAVLEALAARLPVIITRSVGARDLVDDGVNGFILDRNPSTSDFARKLEILLKKDIRRQIGEIARQTALRHSWENTAGQVAGLYHQCLKENQ